MGRYFKTATPQSIDYMYQLPEQLMFKVAEQASQDITENQAAMYDLYSKLQLSAIPSDKQRAKEILGGYEDKVNEISQKLYNDPLAFRRSGGEITSLARQIHKDFTTGEAAAISSRYNQDVEWLKRQQELIKSGKLKDAESVNNMRAFYLSADKARGGLKYDPVTGNYNQLDTEEFVGYVDLIPRFDSYMKDVKAKVTNWADASTNGEYIYEENGERRVLSMSELQDIALKKFVADNDVQSFIQQRSKIGSIQGWYDQSGKLILPKLTTDEKGRAKYEWPEGYSALRNVLEATADTYDLNDGGVKSKSIKSDGNYGINKKALDGVGIDIATGRADKDSLVIDRKSSVAPITQLATRSQQLRSDGELMINDAIARTADVIASMQGANKAVLLQGLKDAKAKADQGDPKALFDFCAKNNIKDKNIVDAFNQYKENWREADNITSQIEMYKDVARKANPNASPAQIEKDANELMKNEKANKNAYTLTETNGSYFTDNKERQTFNEQLVKLGTYFVNGNIPTTVIQATTDPKTGIVSYKEVSGTDLKASKLYKDFAEREKKEIQTPGSMGSSKTNEFGKEPSKIIATKVLEPVAYSNSKGEPETIDSPYKIQISDNVSIIIPKQNFPSKEIEDVIGNNQLQIRLDSDIKQAKISSAGARNLAKEKGVKFQPHVFSILDDGIQYLPPTTEDGLGDISVEYNGKIYTAPENDEDIMRIIRLKQSKK